MYIIGDIHSLKPLFTIIEKNKLTDCNIIQVGDTGIGFQEITKDINDLLVLDEMLIENNIKLYMIRGNHCNPIFWDKSRGLNLPKFRNLFLVEDYSVKNIEGYNVLFVGGAISIDRIPRKNDKPYPTWWEDEKFKLDLVKLDAIKQKYFNIDVVITHNSPNFCYPIGCDNYIVNMYAEIERIHATDLKEELNQERSDITEMYDTLTKEYDFNISYWCYGHFHSSHVEEINGTVFRLLNINEIKEL